MTSIGYSAFWYCPGLISIHCKSKTPPSLDNLSSSPFDDNTYSSATLYVPQGSVEVYKSAKGWKKFQNIVEE